MANPPSRPGLPSEPWSFNRLGERIERMATRAIIYSLGHVRTMLSEILAWGVELFIESFESAIAPRVAPAIDQILDVGELPTWLRDYLDHLRHPESQADVAGISSMAMGLGSQAASGLMAPISRKLNYAIEHVSQSARPTPGENMALRWRYPDGAEELDGMMLDLGYTPELTEFLEQIMRPRIGTGDLVQAALMGSITRGNFETELKRRGYTDVDAFLMEAVARPRPGPADIIRMAVRGAFTREEIDKFQLHADLPGRFVTEMDRLGFLPGAAENFWASHWELPSAGYGMEMLHRGIIDPAEFKLLLKALDISPYWRPLIEKMSYAVPTRVDTRRAYQSGVIDRDKVKRIHLDLGYTPEWAEILTQWVEQEYAPEERDLTKADILKAFKRGTFSEAEARTALKSLGYALSARTFYIQRAKLELAEELHDTQISVIQKKYERGQLTEGETRIELSRIDLPSSEIELLLEKWTITRESRVKQPSKADWESFYMDDIVTAQQYLDGMDKLQYPEQYRTLYLRSLDAEKATIAAAETERAAKEAQRATDQAEAEAEKARKAAEAEREKAEREAVQAAFARENASIDYQIALQRQIIANANSAINVAMTEVQIERTRAEIAQRQAERAAINEAIATTETRRTEARTALREKISDVERNRLESGIDTERIAIRDEERAIAGFKTEVAELELRKVTPVAQPQVQALLDRINDLAFTIVAIRESIAGQRVELERLRSERDAAETEEVAELLQAQIDDVEIEIARFNADIAANRTEIESLEREIEETPPAVDVAAITEEIKTLKVAIATREEAIAAHNSEIARYQAALRAYIDDDSRQRWERTVREATVQIELLQEERAAVDTLIAQMSAQVKEEISDAVRADLLLSIEAAKAEIAALQVEKAQLKMER